MKVVEDYNIIHNKIPQVTILVERPFKSAKAMNKYYFMLIDLLENNTNRLILGNRYKNGMPINKQMLQTLFHTTRQNVDKIMGRFISSGVLMLTKTNGISMYYMNPKYVICGNKVGSSFANMFNNKGKLLNGIHNYNVQGTVMEKATNESITKNTKLKDIII